MFTGFIVGFCGGGKLSSGRLAGGWALGGESMAGREVGCTAGSVSSPSASGSFLAPALPSAHHRLSAQRCRICVYLLGPLCWGE